MAKSLDDLVDFLLDEIALDSGRGASLKDVVRYTKAFYGQPYDNPSQPAPSVPFHPATTRIDKAFISQVWKWLTTHDDLRIGRNDEYRQSSLDQVETEFPDILSGVFSSSHEVNLSADDLTTVTRGGTSKSVSSQRKDSGPRIYANRDRVYYAVCGHEADPSRISELEFSLLCTVGAARHEGILQGELGRVTKQDKRSVPKRTDALQAKGYIEKQAAYNQGHKTSRILLRRFADIQSTAFAIDSTPRLGDLALQILTVMRENPFTTQEDLASRLSVFDRPKVQVLNQVVQYLIRQGCLKKVKTAFAPGSASADLKPTLRYIQALEVGDYENTNDSVIDLNTSLDTAVALIKESVDCEDEDAADTEPEISLSERGNSYTCGRPNWNPDRALPNVVYDLATLGGDNGITNMAVREQITGIPVRRPAEALLVRLSHAALKAQPSVAHDLALVRTTEVKDGVHRFVHRTLDSFNDLVGRGDLSWSATSGGSDYAKYLNALPADGPSNPPRLDHFGFRRRSRSSQQIETAGSTIEDVASVPGPDAAVIVRPGEATIVKNQAGVVILSTKPDHIEDKSERRASTPRRPSYVITLKLRPGSLIHQSTDTISHESAPTKAKLKPRTFLRGTHKFWMHMFQMKKLEIDPDSSKVKQEFLMSDPDCLQMFADRPKDFDSLLVRALKQGLPAPRDPTRIDQAWVDQTKAFLDSTNHGAFHIPSGFVDPQQRKLSCLVVIRSNRLGELDIINRSHHTSVCFLSSSAAHTLRVHSIPKWYENASESSQASSPVLAHIGDPPTQQFAEIATFQKPQKGETGRESLSLSIHRKNSLVVTLPLAKSNPWPSSGFHIQQKSYGTSMSDKGPTSQHERVQRQRRPTRKALESARMVVPEVSTPGSSSSRAATPTGLYISRNNAPRSDLLLADDAISLTDTTRIDIERDAADVDQAIYVDVAYNSGQSVGDTVIHDRSPLDSSNTTALQLRGDHGLAKDSHFLTESEDVRTTNPSQVQSDPADISIVPSEAERDTRVNSESAVQADCADTAHLAGHEGTIQDEFPGKSSEIPASSSRNTAPAIGSSQLMLLTGKDAVPYYRKFLMELVYMCGGVVPNDPSLLKRAMGPKSSEAHVEANMNIKLIKTSIGALTQTGKLKVMQFAFQRNGFNHTKAILALPSTQPNDQLFISMQAKISLLPANIDYVPPELEIEATRKPQGILRTADSPAPEAKAKSKIVTPARPKRQKNQSGVGSRGGSTDPIRELIPLEISSNTGFLTLKVPRIAEVQTDQLFTSKYFELPAQPVIVDTGRGSETTYPVNSSLRRNSARNSRRFTTATRKVQWRSPKCTQVPKSLRAILAYDHRANQIDHALNINPALETFDRDVDSVAAWEQKYFDDLQEPKPHEWNFINHFSFRKELVDVRGEGDLKFCIVKFNELQEEEEEVLPEPESWDVFAAILTKEATKARKATERKAKRKRSLQEQNHDGQTDDEGENSDFMSSDGEPPKKKRQRGPNHKWRRKPRIAGTELDRRRQKRSYVKPRGVGLRDIPKAWAHRITTAIVVVRVLTGGLDKYLDWKLVARLIPGEPESVLQSRWRTISTRYNNDFDAMVHDLQTKYLDALADNNVPSVNYNDLPGTDWEAIFEWAIVNINADNKGTTVIELPPNREEFLELVAAEVGEPTSVRPLHNMSLQYTQATKEDFWCSMVMGTTPGHLPKATPRVIEPVFQTEDDETDLQLARARSWVFAAVMTPQEFFDPKLTHERLRRLATDERDCEQLIDTVIKDLQNDKMVVTKDSADAVIHAAGTTLSGTYHWKLSTKFVDRFELNRHITSTMLKQAVKYKIEVLDPAFACGEVITIPGDPYIEDGVMVAIFNLINTGMMQLDPGSDLTANRYGVDGGKEGYKTRSMDKRHLYFSVMLRPTSSYVHGDLAITEKRQVSIPRGDIDQPDGMGLIPMWFDINHEFRPDVWDMVVGAIVGLISCRPGASSLELVRTLQYAIPLRDMAMIVEYLFDCKLVVETRSGWETTEVWWFAVGTGAKVGTEVENGIGGAS